MRLNSVTLVVILAGAAEAQAPRQLMPIPLENSAEYAWLRKPVLASRVIDDNSHPENWKLSGAASLSFPAETGPEGMKTLRVEMKMFPDSGAPPRTRLAAMNLAHPVAGEDWSGYNRISMWVKPEISGFPTMPIEVVLHSAGAEKTPDKYGREGAHLITFSKNEWQHVVWEIDAYPRDKVTLLEFGYFINKLLPAPTDKIAFQIGRIELERVAPDKHTGWDVARGKVSFSNTGYQTGSTKSAIASGLATTTKFDVIRMNGSTLGPVVLTKQVTPVKSRLGDFQVLDFSAVNAPGRYVLRTGNTYTESFAISDTVWKSTVWKSLNFLYGQRCGFDVPGVHGIDHLDWFATLGPERITMSGGWHDAGDLSQGLINTGELTYALFALAETVQKRGDDPALLARVLEEAKWGLDWVMRVRFPGGYRMGFASHNFWSNNVVGDADDRTREAKNNPNVNYIAASAGAIAHRALLHRDPALAAKALSIAEDDWSYAIAGVEGPSTWHTPAFAATRVELAGIGITASIELYRETGKQMYADKAIELARIVTASQQTKNVGSAFPLNGFFYTGPDRDTLFHEFHRGNDQAAVVGLTQLIRALPKHAERKQWMSAVTAYAEYQKRTASTTAPYNVLPNYVYRVGDEKEVADSGALHNANREDYRAQVLQGMPMGDGWYLRTFPVWFARRGNFGILLSQAKALSAVGRLRGDRDAMNLAQQQAQWIVGRNPFSQSTMYGEGYGWSQQYSVSSGDFVGSLIVGMQSAGNSDLPYWSTGNMYVWKEVWVHSTARWLWLMADLLQ